MSLDACARIVADGDPDRFKAVMAAPLKARKTLLPIYAFNVEVARAPFASAEPMIAEMRLQWWWDVLQEIVDAAQVRSHEVTTPLAEVLDAEGARGLQANVDARRRDAHRAPPGTMADLNSYLQDTSGALMWAAARALGSQQLERARATGHIQGLANYLLAVPELRAMGLQPWPAMSGDAFREALKDVLRAGVGLKGDKSLRIAELAAWRAKPVLYRALRKPDAVGKGGLNEPELVKRANLLLAGLFL